MQTASAPVSFAAYNHTTAADECARNTESGEMGLFALVESDGAITTGWANGFIGSCEEFRDMNIRENWEEVTRSGAGGRVAGVGERKYVYLGGGSCGDMDCIGESNSHLDFHQKRRPYGPHGGRGIRYNFETGIWSNDRGEKFKNGKLVE